MKNMERIYTIIINGVPAGHVTTSAYFDAFCRDHDAEPEQIADAVHDGIRDMVGTDFDLDVRAKGANEPIFFAYRPTKTKTEK